MQIAVVTTFPNDMYDVYAKKMLQSFVQHWPEEVALLVQLDDDLLADQVENILRPQDAVAVGWNKEHADFVQRNKDKDSPTNYRHQVVKFCHKVFAIHRVLEAAKKGPNSPRYLIWMDADVITTKNVSIGDLMVALPREGLPVSYLGRKDWDHSECGWLGFDLQAGGDTVIDAVYTQYKTDGVFQYDQWHDSYIFDKVRIAFTAQNQLGQWTNLTENKPGMDIWQHSPMGKWSTHYKGPAAKSNLFSKEKPVNQGIKIETKNAIAHEEIRAHIEKNQTLIKNWIRPCVKTDEQIVVVSAGPMLIAEEVRAESGKKIIAVKHALVPLKKAGIKPWACILLDPRPHVLDFIQDADPEILWFVASQVNPQVTLELLAKGCTVWGYHASVNAGEEELTSKQRGSIVGGGSATATRGLFMLNHLGFSNFKLYGYDLCVPDKPDMNEKDNFGQPKYFEFSVGMNDPLYNVKKLFWAQAELIAQFEEINDLIKNKKFTIEAVGDGVVPFMLKSQKISDLRRSELQAKIIGENPPTYMELLNGTNH